MADVYVRFSTNRVVRTMAGADGGANVDLDEDGQMVGVELLGAISVTMDGEDVSHRADTWELAALAALSTGLDKATADRVGQRMREIVYGSDHG